MMAECKWMLRILGKGCLEQLHLPKYALFRTSDGVPVIEADCKSALLVKMATYGFKLNAKNDVCICRSRLPLDGEHWTEIYLKSLELKGTWK